MDTEYYTKSSRFWLEDGVIKSRVKEPVAFTAELVRESMEAMEALSGGEPHPRLAFMDGVMFVDREARGIYAGSELISAMALVAQFHDSRFISEFASSSTPTPFPVRIFDSEEEAMAWLAGFSTASDSEYRPDAADD